jgi:hypothetical protein
MQQIQLLLQSLAHRANLKQQRQVLVHQQQLQPLL